LRSVSIRWFAIGVAVIAAVVLVAEAAALTITTAAITFPNVTLNGASQTVLDDSTSAWRANATGEAGGWKVTVSSTDFGDGSGKTIAVSNFEIRLLDTDIVWVSGGTKPTSTQTTFAALSGTGLKIASAAAGSGNGVYDMTPDFSLTVPAETYAGDYTATVTVDISVGP
jgi:hypothetical protein